MHDLNFASAIGYIGYVAGAIIMLGSRVKNENLKDLKDRVDILDKEKTAAQERHVENQKAISNLEGQLSTYKEIPLQKIADSLTSLSSSNSQILAVLESSALIASNAVSAGGMTVKTDEQHPLAVRPVKE